MLGLTICWHRNFPVIIISPEKKREKNAAAVQKFRICDQTKNGSPLKRFFTFFKYFFPRPIKELQVFRNFQPCPAEPHGFIRLECRGWHNFFTLCFCTSDLLCLVCFFPSFVNKGLFDYPSFLFFGIPMMQLSDNYLTIV